MRKLPALLLFLLPVLGAFGLDGVDYYYGLGVPQDYRLALAEFQKEKSYHSDVLFQILIYLNGDGVPSNPDKALEIWTDKIAAKNWSDVTTDNLKDRIDERREARSAFPRLEFSDVALTTVDINAALDIGNRIQDDEKRTLFARVERGLTKRALEYWRALNRAHEALVHSDSERTYTEHIEGTIRNAAALGMTGFLVERHLNRTKKWLVEGVVEPYSDEDFRVADARLNAFFQELLVQSGDSFKEMIEISADDPAAQKKYEGFQHDIGEELRAAQRAWAEYRDLWAALMVENTGGKGAKALRTSIAASLTNDRLEELDYSRHF